MAKLVKLATKSNMVDNDCCRNDCLLTDNLPARISSSSVRRSSSLVLSKLLGEQQRNRTMSSLSGLLDLLLKRNLYARRVVHRQARSVLANNQHCSHIMNRSFVQITCQKLSLARQSKADWCSLLSLVALLTLFACICRLTPSVTAQRAPSNYISNLNLTNVYDDDRLGRLSMQDLRNGHLNDKLQTDASQIFETLFKKKPYSKYWTVEQKWDDLFLRFMSIQSNVKQLMVKNMLRGVEHYADLGLSKSCEDDLKYVQDYAKQSNNFRWLIHMLDSSGKNEPGMLTGNLAHLGHVVQCIKVRAPAKPSNHSFSEQYFEQQTRLLGERFRGKYCLASIRPVMPQKPHLVSRFSELFNESILSNISYMGEPVQVLKQRARQLTVPSGVYALIDREHNRLDQIPFESELYAYLIRQRTFMYTLPRYLGSCYPSSCSREDIRMVLQKMMDDQHQVVDIEFECEQEQRSLWDWLITPRLLCYVLLGTIVALIFSASLARYIMVDKMRIKRSKLPADSQLANVLDALDLLSMDKCAGILFVKTKPASPFVDWTKIENNRSTSIDGLRGLLIMLLVYSQLVTLGCLPVPFMWSKWADAMFPFFRSAWTQIFINMHIWTEAFYIISAYLIGVKFLENHRPRLSEPEISLFKQREGDTMPVPNIFSFAIKRYIRLLTPMIAFMLLNYIWPQLSHGFVMQDQASKLMAPCDSYGWTNLLLFHNHYGLNETCLWPSHVSASFFQLHLISYPILLLCLMCLYSEFNHSNMSMDTNNCNNISGITSTGRRRRRMLLRAMKLATYGLIATLALVGAIYPALKASDQGLIVPFLIDYFDYDNYERVLEWMVMPFYNHLTGYMFGLLLAFIVAQKRMRLDLRPVPVCDLWLCSNAVGGATGMASKPINRDGSLESVRSLSTDGIVATFHQRPASELAECKLKFSASTCTSSSSEHRASQDDEQHERINLPWDLSKTLVASLIAVVALISSWLWNGFGQPMSDEQTFWYVVLTKLAFCASFVYIFNRYFAQRRNCNNPWMVTRFMVPIGRMSLSVFYVSWIVIWFDLLSSLYQWHPSHYFVFEKFTEITFITLILSMFVYGAFEGIIKRCQLGFRREKSNELNDREASWRQDVNAFECFYQPKQKKMSSDEQDNANQEVEGKGTRERSAQQSNLARSQIAETTSATSTERAMVESSATLKAQTRFATTNRYQVSAGFAKPRDNLSPIDQYKLNAELRANYSFASIGLYESAGATGDLSQFRGSQSSFDPQVSPASSRNDKDKA